jgi:hypothetical protein
VKDEYSAYCLDEAVLHFGNLVEAELEKAPSGKTAEETMAKRSLVLRRILEGRSLFADPLSSGKTPIKREKADG